MPTLVQRITSASFLLLSLAIPAFSSGPATIPFQGVLDNAAGQPLTGTSSVKFSLYLAASGGTALWTETKTVAVAKGAFATQLGTVTPLPASLTFDQPYYLGIQVGADAEMPRVSLGSVPYALSLPNVFVDRSTGNVGVGTSQPVAQIDVARQVTKPAGQFLDQSATAFPQSTYADVSTGQPVGQSFIPRLTGKLSRLDIMLSNTGGQAWTGTLSFYAGEGSGTTPLATYSVGGAATSTTTFESLSLGTGVDVTAGSKYTFMLTLTSAHDLAVRIAAQNVYPDGIVFYNGDAYPSDDMIFRTYVTISAGNVPVHNLTVRSDSGFVGINTASPAAALDVHNGSILVGSDAGGGGAFLSRDSSDAGILQLFDDAGFSKVYLTAGSTSGGGYAGIVDSSGITRASLSVDGTGQGAVFGDYVFMPSDIGDKISLWGDITTSHYGLGIQGSLLQIYSGGSGADVAFGYGSSAAFTENMRIKGTGNVGIGTSSPNQKLDVRGNVKIGSNNDLYAAGGAENLYILRGIIGSDGSAVRGSGFTSTRTSAGHYTIQFSSATFVQPPAVSVTPWTSQPVFAVTPNLVGGTSGGAYFTVITYLNGTATDCGFTFIATAFH